MPKYVTKNLPLFFSPRDEARFEAELGKAVPATGLIDGAIWECATPLMKTSLAECQSGIVYLWDRRACPSLPHQVLDNGRTRGPTSGVVIQYIRSIYRDGVLTSGDIGIGYDNQNAPIVEFVKKVFKVVRAMNAGTLESIDRKTGDVLESELKEYIVGLGVVELVQKGAILKHCSADVYYRIQHKC
jgi:hypothetical protein